MANWTRQPQEREGKYYFYGKFLVTKGVHLELDQEEVMSIYFEIQELVQEYDGLDYLQVFIDENDRKLFFIDQLDKHMIESGDYRKEDNHCTLLFAHEY